MTPRLHRAVENAYEAFGWRKLNAPLEACYHCCMSEEMAASILKTPLRGLSNEQLSKYTNSAHGWSDQFLFLLPRYMDLISQDHTPCYIGVEYTLSRFWDAPDHCMTGSEEAAFGEWMTAFFEESLCRPIDEDDIYYAVTSSVPPAWYRFGQDVCEVIFMTMFTPYNTTRFQTLWSDCEAREANLRLASTITFISESEYFKWDQCYSKRVRDAQHQWLEWFTLTDHREKLIEAFERETNPYAQELLLSAI